MREDVIKRNVEIQNQIDNLKKESEALITLLKIDDLIGGLPDAGEVSDGYHTFNELYRYRMLYNAAFFNLLSQSTDIPVFKSFKHSDGEDCFGGNWFIVVAKLPTGQITNHYENKYWDLFKVPELERAPAYDGHTPKQAADRLEEFIKKH